MSGTGCFVETSRGESATSLFGQRRIAVLLDPDIVWHAILDRRQRIEFLVRFGLVTVRYPGDIHFHNVRAAMLDGVRGQ